MAKLIELKTSELKNVAKDIEKYLFFSDEIMSRENFDLTQHRNIYIKETNKKYKKLLCQIRLELAGRYCVELSR